MWYKSTLKWHRKEKQKDDGQNYKSYGTAKSRKK